MDEATLKKACEFDAAGILMMPGETALAYIQRAEKITEFCRELRQRIEDEGEVNLQGEIIRRDMLLEHNAEGYTQVKEYYDFDLSWIVGFYDRTIGFLQGAAEGVYTEENLPEIPFICLKPAFRKSDTYLGMYKKSECVAHELVHAARESLQEKYYHELFAYRMNSNIGGRYLPGFIRHAWESYVMFFATILGFVWSVFIQPGSFTGYWPLIFVMGGLFVRNFIVKEYFDGIEKKYLQSFGEKGRFIFARLTEDDIAKSAGMNIEEIRDYLDSDSPRFEIIRTRYLCGKETEDESQTR